MKLTKTCLFLSAMTVMLVGLPESASASDTANVPIRANVKKVCTISAAGVTFVDYDPLATAPNTATGSVTIRCTKGASTPIDLGLGSNADGTTRRMLSGTSNYLPYELYKEVEGVRSVWGSGSSGLTPEVLNNFGSRTFTIYGQIPVGQDVPEATDYADTVVATVNF